jgi:hypothetical protein
LIFFANISTKTCSEAKKYETRHFVKLPQPERKPRIQIFHLQKQKQFVLKVWRKPQVEGAKLVPTPMEDAIIGFAAIDLSVLLTGMTPLSGWFNIVDFSGRCNGQLQVRPKTRALIFHRVVDKLVDSRSTFAPSTMPPNSAGPANSRPLWTP